MKRFIILIFCLSASAMASQVNGNGDFQFWFHQSFAYEIDQKTKLILLAEQRWGGNASTLYFYFFQGNIRREVTKWLHVAPGYRQTFFLNLQPRRWEAIYEPMFILYLLGEVKKWKIELRNQVQYRIFEYASPLWLYRLRVELLFPYKLTKIKLQPFVSEEWFFLEKTGFNENRIIVAGRIPVISHLTADLQYIYRNLYTSNRWTYQSIIRVYLHFTF